MKIGNPGFFFGLMTLAGVLACGDKGGGGFAGEIEFEGEQPFLPGFEQDSGWIPAQSPASIRVVARAEGGVVAKARATTDGSSMTAVAGSGELTSSGELVLEISARIDAAGVSFEDVVDSFNYTIDPATTTFDPFLLDGDASVEVDLPASELASVPIPSVPGATLVIDVAGGSLTTTFEGTCAESAAGVGQYTGRTITTGTVNLEGTIEISLPPLVNESFGPFELPVDIPALMGEIDLGARSLSTAEPVEDPLPCEGGVAATGGQSMDSDPSTSGSPSSDPSDPSGSETESESETTPEGTTDDASTSGGTETGMGETDITMGGCTPEDECEANSDCQMGEFCSMACTCAGEATCDDCVVDAQSMGGACFAEAEACFESADCSNLLNCVAGCADQACADDCGMMYPDGIADYNATIICLFGEDSMSGACGGICS